MKNIRFALAILLLGFSAVSLTTCGGGGDNSSSGTLNAISTPVVIPVGANQQFTAVGVYSDGTGHDITTQVSWASSNTPVVTVTGSGRATALAAGTVSITAASGSFLGSALLTVTPLTLSSISVTPVNPSVPVGFGQRFVAIGTYSDGTRQDITTQVTWASLNTSVATIDSTGRATASAAGSATITATLGGISGSTTITVTSATLSSSPIAITPANQSIPVGVPQQFTAIGTFSDGTSHDITSQVTWSSSNPSMVTINNSSGLAVAVAVGTVTITATSGSISGTAILTVTSATLSSVINVIPATIVGTIQQFVAFGAFSDGSTKNISNEVFWTSSSPSVATISNTGVVTALSAGSTTIIANTLSNFFPGQLIQGGTSITVFP